MKVYRGVPEHSRNINLKPVLLADRKVALRKVVQECLKPGIFAVTFGPHGNFVEWLPFEPPEVLVFDETRYFFRLMYISMEIMVYDALITPYGARKRIQIGTE